MGNDFYIEELEQYVASIEKDALKNIINLSDWNPSNDFMNSLAIDIPYTFKENPISYIFSSDFDEQIRDCVIRKWNYKNNRAIVFFNTGSESILNTLYLLSRQGCKKVYTLCPTYFSIEPICETLHIEYQKVYLAREDNNYIIPKNLEKYIESNSCLWITNPVYCTGTLYLESDIKKIEKIIQSKNIFLVNDESLCFRHFTLSNRFEYYERYINIITPHKSLCTNALKFSGVILSDKYYKSMDQWSDILEGCLGIGAKFAIKHFLSNSFNEYEKSFIKTIEGNKEKIVTIANKYGLV